MTQTFIIQLFVSFIVFWLLNRYWPKRRIYCNDEGWLPISTVPQELHESILMTDGEVVECAYTLSYNYKGQVAFGYPKRIATHWRKYPLPPMKKD